MFNVYGVVFLRSRRFQQYAMEKLNSHWNYCQFFSHSLLPELGSSVLYWFIQFKNKFIRNKMENGNVVRKCLQSGVWPGVTFPSFPTVLPCVGISRKEWEGSCSVNYSALARWRKTLHGHGSGRGQWAGSWAGEVGREVTRQAEIRRERRGAAKKKKLCQVLAFCAILVQ